jgi:O-antigen/teichoic acid export membrane protein
MTASGEPLRPTGFIAAWRDRLRLAEGEGGISRTLAHGALWSLAINVGGAAIALGVQMLLTHALGHVEYGHYVYALAWMNAALLVAKLELDTSALRFVGMYHGRAEWSRLRGFLTRSHQIVRATSVMVAAIGAAIVWVIMAEVASPLVTSYWAACALLPFSAMMQFKASCLQGFKKVPESQGPSALLRPALFGAGVLLATLGFGVKLGAPGAIALNLVATIPALLLTARFLRDAVPVEARDAVPAYETRSWMNTSFSLLLIAGAQLVLGTQADVLVVGTMLGTTEAGVYGVASQLAALISFGVTAIVFIALPMIADLHARSRQAELQHLVNLVRVASVAVSLPVVALLAFMGPKMLGWFGPTFVTGYHVLLVLAGAHFVAATTGILAGFLLALTGHQRQAAVIVVGSAIVNLALSLVLTHTIGTVGTAIATATTTLVRSVVLAVYCWKLLGVRVVPLLTSVNGARRGDGDRRSTE